MTDEDYNEDYDEEGSSVFLAFDENGVGKIYKPTREISIMFDFEITDEEFEKIRDEVLKTIKPIFEKYQNKGD